MREAFRADAEAGSFASFKRVAEAAGVDTRTARRAWQRGWPPAIKPICEVIAAEKVLARAALRTGELKARAEAAAQLASEDAAEERAMEGKGIRLVASSVRNLLASLHQSRVSDYTTALATLMQDKDPAVAREARKAFRDVTDIVCRLAEGAATAQRMTSLVLGSATSIVGGEVAIHPVAPLDATPELLAKEIEAATRALESVRALEAKAKDGDGANGVAN